MIYSISCNLCNKEYIGQTCTPLHICINQHRSDINNNISNDIEYFNFQLHDFNNITIKLLTIHKNLNDRLLYETIYIKTRNSLYTWGLYSNVFK